MDYPMPRLARFLSILGLLAAILTISVTHFDIPPVEYGIMVVISSVSIFLALASTGLALLLVSFLLLRKVEPMPVATVMIILLTLSLSGVWLVINF